MALTPQILAKLQWRTRAQALEGLLAADAALAAIERKAPNLSKDYATRFANVVKGDRTFIKQVRAKLANGAEDLSDTQKKFVVMAVGNVARDAKLFDELSEETSFFADFADNLVTITSKTANVAANAAAFVGTTVGKVALGASPLLLMIGAGVALYIAVKAKLA